MANLQICGGAYSVEAPISVQECINLFPEVEKVGAQERVILRRFPGLTLLATLGAKIRGLKRMDGTLYAVAGTELYSVTSAGAATSLGTIPGNNIVSMATDGTNLIIVNGTATGYVYNGTLSTITDTDFDKADIVFYLDTYFVFHKTNTNQFFISAAGDGTDFNALDIASKEGQPGKIISMAVANRNLLLFGEQTTEFWRNIGAADFPFARQDGTFQERGARGLRVPCEIDGTVYFLGNDLVVYKMMGYRAQRVSDHALEKWLSEQDDADVDSAVGMAITHQGHFWFVLSLRTGTWAYDITTSALTETSEWFQLQSWETDNWRVDLVETCYNKTICGDGEGNLYYLDPSSKTENGNRMLKRRVTPYYQNERKPISCPRLELGFKQGVANDEVADPQVFLEISRDWGRTWGARRQRSMGVLGDYKEKAIWRRNGHSRGFCFRFTVTDNVDVTFTGGYGDFTTGSG